MSRRRILFLQLPHADNDVSAAHENLPLAAGYLRGSMKRSGEGRFYDAATLPAEAGSLDDARLVEAIGAARPDVIAATLYLWNVERSLHVFGRVKARNPGLRVLVGGPEVARSHPFLYRSGIVDVAAVGEGETVFPEILAAARRGAVTDLATVGWRQGGRLRWGVREPHPVDLREALPPAADPLAGPDARGMAYMEASRGCPLRCAFCSYPQQRSRVSYLPARDVMARVLALKAQGAREIRFIDPTFNANPEFEAILEGLAGINPGRDLRFFAELRADRITGRQAGLLARANVRDVEVGVQSRDAAVLRRAGRPTDLRALDRGVAALARSGVRMTVDVMWGLPGQTPADVRRSLRWASGVRGANVQFLPTLLLPGTSLRRRARALGLRAEPRPPYRVISTPDMGQAELAAAQRLAERAAGRRMDCATRRFVGVGLPDLFPDRHRVPLDAIPRPWALPGCERHRALMFRGRDLFARRETIRRWIRLAIRSEPFALWQFVLEPADEEPLDLLDALIEEIDRAAPHLVDRMTVTPRGRARAARRVMVRLRRGGRHSRSWARAAESMLAGAFH